MQETYVFKFISLGESVGAKEINVDQEMIDHYAVSSLDYNPVHTNLPWAEQVSNLRQTFNGRPRYDDFILYDHGSVWTGA